MGGAEKSLVDVLDKWVEEYSIEPVIIIKKPAGSLVPVLKKRGWKYHVLDYSFWSHSHPPTTVTEKYRTSLKNTRAIVEIEKIIQITKPDLVLTNSVVAPWAALAAHYQRVPHIWMVREYGDLDHGRVFEIGREKTFNDVGNLSNLVVANSLTLAKHLENYIDKEKIEVLYNPFDLQKMKLAAAEEIKSPFRSKGSLKLVITGSLTPSKGQLEVVEAVGLLNKEGHDVELCIVGKNGPRSYQKSVKKAIKKYHLKTKVHMVGHQPNPMSYVSLADIGVMASRQEAFGRVTFEYIAVGKPVVGSNSGATPEIVEEGKNGYLFEPGNIDKLARCIKKYDDNRSSLKTHSSYSISKARQMARSKYNSDHLYKKISDVISQPQKVPVIFYSHRWLTYPQIANDYIIQTGQASIKKLAVSRLRMRAGNAKRKVRALLKRGSKNN